MKPGAPGPPQGKRWSSALVRCYQSNVFGTLLSGAWGNEMTNVVLAARKEIHDSGPYRLFH